MVDRLFPTPATHLIENFFPGVVSFSAEPKVYIWQNWDSHPSLSSAPGWPFEHLTHKPNHRANVVSALNSNGEALEAVPRDWINAKCALRLYQKSKFCLCDPQFPYLRR